jgi:Fe2+ transport system protein FeoA
VKRLRFSLNNVAWGPDVLLPLELLNCGEWADVAEIYGDLAWVSRLAELGVRVGCRLRVIQAGRPCLLEIGGVRLSLRSDPALQIVVRPVETAETLHAKTA